MYELMGKLQLQIIYSDFNSKTDISTQLLWVKVICQACRKSCCIRKRSGEKLEKFILRIIVSIWSVHVFASSVSINSEWHQANPDWNVCKARTSVYFEKLKRASIQDSEDLTDDGLQTKAYFKCFSYVKELSLHIIKHHQALIERLSIYVKGVEHDVILDIESGKE